MVSVNEPCPKPGSAPTTVFQQFYEGVRVQCAQYGQDYSAGQVVPIRGAAPDSPAVPADAVTASASGLDPTSHRRTPISRWPGWPALVGSALHRCSDVVARNQHGRLLGFVGEPIVNVLALNLELDRDFPAKP